MRIDLRSLSLLLVIGCGGGGGGDTTTTPAMPPEGEPMAETTPPPAETPPAETPPAEPAKPVIPDAVTAGPDIYKVALENDKVRVFEVTFAPGAKIAMHQHPDHAVYALVGGTLKITPDGGEAKDMTLKTGDAGFFPAESHSAENATGKEIKAIVIEVKPGAEFKAGPAAGDPLKVGRGMYKKVWENDRVRILTVKFNKGQSIKPHSHPDHVAFVTSAGALKVSPAEGEAVEMDLAVGQAVMIDGGIHSAKATKGKPQAIIFEFKGAAAAAPTEPSK